MLHYFDSCFIAKENIFWIDTEYCDGKTLQNLIEETERFKTYLNNEVNISIIKKDSNENVYQHCVWNTVLT